MHKDLDRCLALIEGATAGLDDGAGSVRLDGRWSIAEIVEHLDRTYSGTVKGLQRCLDQGAVRASSPTLKSRLRTFVVVTLGRFPTGIEAPRHVVPSGEVRLSDIVARARGNLAALDAMATTIGGRFGGRPVMDHPILGPFTMAQWLRFHHRHTRHHERQIVDRRSRIADGRQTAR